MGQGGDELNHVVAGRNYGWPAITYGVDYSGAVISPFTEADGMEQPMKYWVPSIGPSGLPFIAATCSQSGRAIYCWAR